MIKMNKFGSSLTTRASGRNAYQEISKIVETSENVVVFDFAGIEVISNSFADEVFGRLASDYGMEGLRKRTTFVNVAPFWARVIREAIDGRLAAAV